MDTPASESAIQPAGADISRLLVAIAAALGLGLTVLHPSATRLEAWPWAGFAVAGWLLPIGVVLWRLLRAKETISLGRWVDAGIMLLAAAILVSALASPQRGLALAAALPALGACAIPYALLPFLRSPSAPRVFSVLGVAALVVVGVSALLWLQPWDWRGWPAGRNEFPFGHANMTGSIGLLATTWLAVCAARSGGRLRVFFVAGAFLAIVVTLSSASRGAGLALAAAFTFAAALLCLRRGRFLVFLAVSLSALAVVIGTNERLRQLVAGGEWSAISRESNDQRIAMVVGGLRLGLQRPLLGWGPGSVPHVFPSVRAGLPGTADNVVQLHNSFAQTWATLGATGMLALAVLSAGLLRLLRAQPWTPDRICLGAGLTGGAIVILFDHPFAVPAFAVLAGAHLAAWCAPSPAGGISGRARVAGWAGLAALLPVVFATARDLPARAAYAAALDSAAMNDRIGYVAGLRRAAATMPADVYYRHQLAAYFATAHPFHGEAQPNAAAAIAELRTSLQQNPHLEYAHYNLGWLLLEQQVPREAAAHFLAAARLAPQRGSVYFGLGLARLGEGDTAGAVRAFATEFLNDPAFAWSPLWFEGALAPLRSECLRAASSAALPPSLQAAVLRQTWAEIHPAAPVRSAYRRLRTGYGVLMGHPDGPPPVDVNVQTSLSLSPKLAAACPDKGWLGGDFLIEFLFAVPR